MENTTANPYGEAVMDYITAGWQPLLLPLGEKFPPPAGYTGRDAKIADEETLLMDWMETPGNIGLKMPSTVIGIDVDRDKKTGKRTGWMLLQKLTKILGPLPIEYISTSRADKREGFTAFFTVPEGIEWESGIGGCIDIIQSNHRYQVTAPSIHPDSGRQYAWRDYETDNITPFIPEVDDLPALPVEWIKYLSKKKPKASTMETMEQEELVVDTGDICLTMKSILARRVNELKKNKVSRHDCMVLATWAMVNESHKGHGGGDTAMMQYFASWRNRFTEQEAANRDLREEFTSAVRTAKEKMQGTAKRGCSCGQASRNTKYRKVRQNSDVAMFRR